LAADLEQIESDALQQPFPAGTQQSRWKTFGEVRAAAFAAMSQDVSDSPRYERENVDCGTG